MIQANSVRFTGIHHLPLVFSTCLGLGLWLSPNPEGVSLEAWHLFAVFVATIIGIVLKALPMGAMSLIALGILTITNTLPLNKALSGFSSNVIWLVVMAFFVAKSCTKTGLGLRIAYHLVALLGKRSLGLAYGMAITDLVLAPAIPSNTARGGGVVFPIIKSLALTFNSSPEHGTSRKIGSFLIVCAYHVNIITSAMFITAMVANPVMVEIAEDFGVTISWIRWFIVASVPGILSLLLIPLIIHRIYPPEVTVTPEATDMAHEKLKEMGRVSLQEWVTCAVFVLLLVLWVFGKGFGVDPTTAAIVGVAILLVTRVLTWRDVIGEEGAWDTLIWFSTLVMMANTLNSMGVIGWLASLIKSSVVGIAWPFAFAILVLSYFYSHYFFASNMAHASSLFSAFAMLGIVVDIPPTLIVFSLAFTTSLSACLTHYGTGPAPILFGAGYVDLGKWWKIGGVISLVHLVIWFGIGSLWWKFLGVF